MFFIEKSFNIVFLGLRGTGKSASANTIMLAENPALEQKQLFISNASSLPVTTECSFKVMSSKCTSPVYLVDTPDFLHEELANVQQHLQKCRTFFQPGQFVVLLVMQAGRTTDSEKDLLEKLEILLGWKLRECAIVLLTHKEDLIGTVQEHVKNDVDLRAIVESCGGRCHAFSNKSKNRKQVVALIKQIQNVNSNCPKFRKLDCILQ